MQSGAVASPTVHEVGAYCLMSFPMVYCSGKPFCGTFLKWKHKESGVDSRGTPLYALVHTIVGLSASQTHTHNYNKAYTFL